MIIELLNGTQIDTADYNLYLKEPPKIPSVEISHQTENVAGRDGLIFIETKFSGRTIPVDFIYESVDTIDYILLRSELNALFAMKEAFFIIFKDEPYKRWKVRLASSINLEPEEIEIVGEVHVDFICENIFAESIATTLEMENKKEWDADIFGWNNTITWDDELNYTFTNPYFNVKNLGNVDIDPRQHDLIITIKGDFSNGLTLANNTTNEVYEYNGSLTTSDTLVIEGIRTLKNSISDFGNTNKKLITLAVGDNHMEILGGTLSSISFNFRFLYK